MQRARLVIRGVVQGVGFRPFVYRLAQEHALNGWVLNSTEGVVVEVEGERVDAFVRDLPEKGPPLARIDRVETTYLPPVGYSQFAIHASEEAEGAVALVSPDVALCDDCRRELFDPADRRYLYPFINCTNCGPRFTIVKDIPYDRPKTTMAVFPMCPACQREYDDPTDRRFHAQPNACPVCGPHVSLVAGAERWEKGKAIPEARRRLRAGQIVAVKGLGGFHLACDATNETAVAELRRRKRRVEKPFAVMVRDVDVATALCEMGDDERHLLLSPQRPIVLLRARREQRVAPSVAPRNSHLGVMLPYTPLHHLLFHGDSPSVLVVTSGNLSEEPIATGNDEALARLAGLADAFLLHDRDIHVRCDDSVTRVIHGRETIVRRARGYAPYPVRFSAPVRQILACGAELKNTFCLTRDDYAFLSHHIGDLENEETLRAFEEGIAHFKALFRVAPEAVAYDLHPDYLATQYALRLAERGEVAPASLVGVQHHHAHVASCMAENGLAGPVIGVAFDGTGFGTDGAIWGGEILVADYADFERVGHLAYVPLPGGPAAIHRPYRTALSYANAAFGEIEPALDLLRQWALAEAPGALDAPEVAVIARQVTGALNSPLTSSAGRLFDAVSAIAGVRLAVNYEGQAAIELEMAADPTVVDAYPLPLTGSATDFILDWRPLIRQAVADASGGTSAGVISTRFHNSLASGIVAACRAIRGNPGLGRVVLSGGVFQNGLLLDRTRYGLEQAGFAVYTHHQVPCNDGGIALGQAAVANTRMRD
ncbi:MAG: carbamoyltransferase HypF [Chloroflexota bacterium]